MQACGSSHAPALADLQPPARRLAQVVKLADVRQLGQQAAAVVEHSKVGSVRAQHCRPAMQVWAARGARAVDGRKQRS